MGPKNYKVAEPEPEPEPKPSTALYASIKFLQFIMVSKVFYNFLKWKLKKKYTPALHMLLWNSNDLSIKLFCVL